MRIQTIVGIFAPRDDVARDEQALVLQTADAAGAVEVSALINQAISELQTIVPDATRVVASPEEPSVTPVDEAATNLIAAISDSSSEATPTPESALEPLVEAVEPIPG